MKGGHPASGPAPDPNALRRERDGDDWVTLPAEGRTDPAPDWPLDGLTDRESKLWADEWARPQAVMWETNGQEVEVAMYIRSLVAAEQYDASTTARTLIRQQQEALGLSVPGMARNHWKIGRVEKSASSPERERAKSRFKVVSGGAA